MSVCFDIYCLHIHSYASFVWKLILIKAKGKNWDCPQEMRQVVSDTESQGKGEDTQD